MDELMKERHLFHYAKYKHLFFEQKVSNLLAKVIYSAIFTSHVLRNQVKGATLVVKHNWYILVAKDAFISLYK